MKTVELKVLGQVHSPYSEPKDIPIQGKFRPETIAYIEIFDEFLECIKDVDMFSHLMLFYYFDRIKEEKKIHYPFLEDVSHGSFATRNNSRINKLGFSIVKFEKLEGNKIYFSEVDVLDKTPILDIKPYVSQFDYRENVNSGWIEKHFKDGKISKRVILK